MFDAPIQLEDFAGFVRQLHQRPEVSGNRQPASGAVCPPFYQPATGSASLALPSQHGDELWQALGYLLWQTLGYTQVRLYPALEQGRVGMEASARRPLASGGARYPVDLRLLVPHGANGALAPLAGKVLAYAPQYHRLFFAGEVGGDVAAACLRQQDDLAIVISLDFLRTWQKYGNFAYRLSAVDSGLVLGRLLALAAPFADVEVDFDFDAIGLDSMLGLDPASQASYGVLHLRLRQGLTHTAPPDLSRGVTPVPARGDARLSRKFLAAHTLAHATPAHPHVWPEPLLSFQKPPQQPALELPMAAPPAQAWALRQRRSLAHAFTGAALPASAVRNCVQAMQSAWRALASRYEMPCLLVCCLNVAGVPAGLYAVDAGTPALQPLVAGSFGPLMGQALLLQSFDLQKSSFIVHVCTRRWQTGDPRGPRAYRIDQMLTGVALDAGTLAVSDADVSAHAYLGFDGETVARLYGLRDGVTVGAQLCVGAIAPGCELAQPVTLQ
jgi:hypothetical protein